MSTAVHTEYSSYIDMAASKSDAHAVEILLKAAETIIEFDSSIKKFHEGLKGLLDEVLHVPLNDQQGVRLLKKFDELIVDDFCMHLSDIQDMTTALSDASSATESSAMHRSLRRTCYKSSKAIRRMEDIAQSEESELQQIKELINLAEKYKDVKEDQAHLLTMQKTSDGSAKARFISKIKEVLFKEAREAFFNSDLESNPEKLLKHLRCIQTSLKESCAASAAHKKAIQEIKNNLYEIKKQDDTIIKQHLSYIKEATEKLHKVAQDHEKQLEK